MFQFSTKTEINRSFKLADLLKQMSASKEAREEAKLIESVVLKNVLSPTTLYCDADKTIKEIYVFEITLSSRFVPERFIKELDESIKLHTLFNIRHEDYELSIISYKLGAQKGKYYQTNWENDEDYNVPLVNSIPELYMPTISPEEKCFCNTLIDEISQSYAMHIDKPWDIREITSFIKKSNFSYY